MASSSQWPNIGYGVGHEEQPREEPYRWKEEQPHDEDPYRWKEEQPHDEDPYRWKEELPVGVKFKPTDQELLLDYLFVKFMGGTIPAGIISNEEVYEYPPETLRGNAFKHDDGRMYFFTYLKRKDNSIKKSRRLVQEIGYWKATQARSQVFRWGQKVGTKTTLTYYTYELGQNNKKVGRKQNWLMNEYRLPNNQSRNEELALCVVYYLEKTKINLPS